MRTVREPSPWLQVTTFFGFAAVFVGGTLLWMGLGVATVLTKAVWSLLRGRRPGPRATEAGETVVPPGYRAFVALGVLVGLGVGSICGLVAEVGVLAATGAWTLLGTIYGAGLWAAAHHGYLPFPEPE